MPGRENLLLNWILNSLYSLLSILSSHNGKWLSPWSIQILCKKNRHLCSNVNYRIKNHTFSVIFAILILVLCSIAVRTLERLKLNNSFSNRFTPGHGFTSQRNAGYAVSPIITNISLFFVIKYDKYINYMLISISIYSDI